MTLATVISDLNKALADAQTLAGASPPDTTPPDTTIASGPSDSTSTSATFTFTGTDDRAGPLTFLGSIDGGAWAPVTSPWIVSGLAVGAHHAGVQSVDAAGNADQSPAVFFWNVLAPAPPGNLTLVRKSPANTQVIYGGYNFQFCTAVIMAGGKIHQIWNGTNEFDAVSGAWVAKTVGTSDGSPVITRPENFDMAWVPSEGVVYQGTESPGGPAAKFDPVTGIYTTLPTPWTNGDACLLYDAPRDRLLSFGGYINPPTVLRAWNRAAQGPSWTTVPTTNAPAITLDYAKLTYARTNITSQGRVGVLADLNEIYELDGGATNWVHRSTTGTKPSNYCWFKYHEPGDCYFAFVSAAVIAGARTPVVDRFYVCRRSDWIWQDLGVSFPAGHVAESEAGMTFLTDPERQQLIALIANGYTEMWTIDLRGWL